MVQLAEVEKVQYPQDISEEEVCALFESKAPRFGIMKLKRNRGKGPDYLGVRDGKTIRIEVEKSSSDFLKHGHDPAEVDLVMCLSQDCDLPVPITRLVQKRPTVEEFKAQIDRMDNFGLMCACRVLAETVALLDHEHARDALYNIIRDIRPSALDPEWQLELPPEKRKEWAILEPYDDNPCSMLNDMLCESIVLGATSSDFDEVRSYLWDKLRARLEPESEKRGGGAQ